MGGSSGKIGGDGARTFWGDSLRLLVRSVVASGGALIWSFMVLLFVQVAMAMVAQQVESWVMHSGRSEYPGSVPQALPPERDRLEAEGYVDPEGYVEERWLRRPRQDRPAGPGLREK